MKPDRIKKVIENMENSNLKQIIVYSKHSIYYLTGIWAEPGERLIALYINTDGRIELFSNAIFGIDTVSIKNFVHKDGENPVADLASTLSSGAVGIDKNLPSKFLIGIMELRKDIFPVNGSMPVDIARMIKDTDEIEKMRHSSKINDEVIKEGIEAIKDGVTEKELANIINNGYMKRGASRGGTQLVAFGKNCANPHHGSKNITLSKGDSVLFDIFLPINKYWCDMTRTVFFKEITKEQEYVYETVKTANIKAIKKVKNGVPLKDIDKAARSYIEDRGYGKYFTHRTGHNIGLECHELPDVSSQSEFCAKTGMIFSIEPGIYIPDRFGVRIEDLVLVTDDGCEILNSYTKELQIIK